MSSPASSAPPSTARAALLVASASGLLAVGWLVLHVFVGLDFTDEMQYYGEITSLVRTGKFFQDDLFVQQLGYLWVWPFFKLHALAFPDHAYLIVFARLLFVIAYAAVGAWFWRATTLSGGFSPAQKLTGLAVFFAWVPFQLFAFSYNTFAYLSIVALLATWLAREQLGLRRYAVITAGLLTVLTYSYPPAGLVLIAVAVVEAWRRTGRATALRLLGFTAAAGGTVLALILLRHGKAFIDDLVVSARFSGGFSGGQMFRNPLHIVAWCIVALGGGLLVARLCAQAPVPVTTAETGTARTAHSALIIATLVVLLLFGVRWATGFVAPFWFVGLLLALATAVRPGDPRAVADLSAVGLLLGLLFAISGGDGMINFGTGSAAALPFLALYCARHLDTRAPALPSWLRAAAVPLVAIMLLLNGAFHPYREQRGFAGFRPVRGVPAFAGIWTSPTKIETIETFGRLCPPGSLRGKRLLVAGPHGWLYFTTGAEPATCMFFMHFTADADKQDVYDLIAQRTFRAGPPDAIFLTNFVPPPLGARIYAWTQQPHTETSLTLSLGFIRRYRRETDYEFAGQVYLLRREPALAAARP